MSKPQKNPSTIDKEGRRVMVPDTQPPVSKEKFESAGKMHWIHWLVVILSIVLTIAAWYFSKEQVSRNAEERFHREADQVVELVKERMNLYESALWSAVAMIDSKQSDISYPEWLKYSNSLHIDKVYPGINGIGVIFNIKPEQLAAHLHRERKWRPEYALHPQHAESEFWPITYIEPAQTNKKAIGLDMAFEANRYTGIKKARDTGIAQLTGRITLVQDSKKTPGFLFYAPFYKLGKKHDTVEGRREHIIGVAYAPFIMHKLLQGTLALNNRYVSITIDDDNELLYQDNGSSSEDNIDKNPLFNKRVNVDMYGREWVFQIDSNQNFRSTASNSQPYFILGGGVIIDTLLLALFVFLSRANRTALNFANQMKVNAAKLEKSNNDLERFAFIASHDLKSPLNAINKLVSWIEEDIGDDLPETSKKHLKLLRNRSARMAGLLDDLLEYARVGYFDHKPEWVNLKQVVDNSFELMDTPDLFSIEASGLEMSVPRVPFELVVRNMISNALKHHDRSTGKIEVTGKAQAHSYVLRIQDDGPGIPTRLQAKVMQMFQTLKSRDEVEGSGMGLALAVKIVQQYHGSLHIDSDGLRGTGIVISWPKPR
ncbi:MAG: CHASE1-domain containing sensor protein/two-component sensor histidine kinase [Gammaproteobacteria bacterium]